MIGIYPFTRLLLRIYADLGDSQWRDLTVWVGLVGAVVCAVAALGEDDVKRALSYGALGQLLAIFAALAVPSGRGLSGVLLVLLVYAFAITGLYLAFGIVEAATGERRLSTLGGLGSTLPGIGTLTLFAALALAGVPPLGAFLGQVLLLSTYLRLSTLAVPALYVLGSLFTVLYLLRLFRGVFLGPSTNHGIVAISRFSVLGLMLVGGLVIVFAALPFWSEDLLSPIVGQMIR
jgi:formate hydrogenlyase subunit 3/multisubunit Na+/H+ antiporter MnhD subunit